MGFDKPEDAGAGNENLPEFCSLSKEYSMLLKDPWSWKDSAGFGVQSIAAIRKQSNILDYFHDSAVVKSTKEEVAEQQVEEDDCLRGSLFEATDDLLWRPQSPLSGTEVLFSLDSMGSHDCTTLLQDENIDQGTSSFRIWEQENDLKDDKNHAHSISYANENRDSDWIWGVPSNQSQFSESVEFESSMPSL